MPEDTRGTGAAAWPATMSSAVRDIDGELRPGARIGDRWIVREALGSGGHATVYRAEHAALGHAVAIKVLHLDRCGTAADEMLGRFRREAQIAARVQHRNVVRVFDWGELDNGWPYFVMQLVPGEDLQALIDRQGALSIAASVDVALQVLAGLGALAELGVVHRDVKPGNVMIEARPDGARIARLVDLGIASRCEVLAGPRFTMDGTVLGTPEYMSPEQIRGLELDGRADVYSLGVALYESLTGLLPFHGKGPCATLALALTQEPAPVRALRPDCPPAIDEIVMRALAKDPEARFESARAMASALAEAADACALPRGAAAWASPERTETTGAKRPALHAIPGKRPAARAPRRPGPVPPPLPPRVARQLELDVARPVEADAVETRGLAPYVLDPPEPPSTTVRLKARPRARAPRGAVRVTAVLIALAIAGAIGLRIAVPEATAEVSASDDAAAATHVVVP